jgi:hypothetical protein
MVNKFVNSNLLVSVVISGVFSLIIVFTNLFDWDFVFSTLEVDIRSIILDGHLPTWSYQFCAGSTRSGDPQSYGQSPLMLLPILFGAVIGAKLILFAAMCVGVYYLKKTIVLIDKNIPVWDQICLLFSFIFGNFFLFHFFEGHLSFSSMFYAFPLLYLSTKIVYGENIKFKEYALNTFFLFILISGGFFQSSIYFVLPLALAFFLYLSLNFKSILYKKDIFGIVASSLCSVFICVYRLKPVFEYQKAYPRTLKSFEWHSLLDQALYFFTPIYNRLFLIPFRQPDYSAGEDSFFSGITVSFVILLILGLKKYRRGYYSLTPLIKLSLCFIFVGVVFSLGNSHPFLPLSILNIPLNGALRVSSRFNFLTYLGMFFLVIELFRILNLRNNLKLYLQGMMILVSFSCLFQQYTLSHFNASYLQLKKYLELESSYEDRMQNIYITKPSDQFTSHMFPPLHFGLSVVNCYQPMSRSTYLMNARFQTNKTSFEWHFMQTENMDQNFNCMRNSFFTQTNLYIDPSCNSGSRIYMNFIQNQDIKKYGVILKMDGYFLP